MKATQAVDIGPVALLLHELRLPRIGLAVGMLGVIVLFKWGSPRPSFEAGSTIGYVNKEPRWPQGWPDRSFRRGGGSATYRSLNDAENGGPKNGGKIPAVPFSLM
jgi:hypothetical protein